MSWFTVGSLTTSQEWQFTPVVGGDLFRIRHYTTAKIYPFRGLICQAQLSPTTLFGIQRLYPKAELEVFQFIAPASFTSRRIGILGATHYPKPVYWRVTLEVWKV